MRALALLFFSLFFSLTFSQVKNNSIGFIENKGQIIDQKSKPNAAVKYLLNTNGLNVQLREKGFSYDVYETEKIPLSKKDKEFHSSNPNFDNKKETPDYSLKYNYHRIDIDFLNTNQNVKLIAEEKSKDYDNYYNVTHARNGITNVHKYKKVTYQNIYNQIDVVFFIPNDTSKVVEYNFIVKPGGKISDIQLKIEGGKTELVENKIRMNLRFGKMEETIPMSWTEQGNSKNEIKINYKKIKKNVYGFEGDLNSSNKIIVIDPVPVRLWGTYFGNGGNTYDGTNISVDNYNCVYYSGSTGNSSIIATSGTHQTSLNGTLDGFVVKFDSNGGRLWGTYYGGSNRDGINVTDIRNDYLIIAGSTESPNNIATIGTHSNTYNSGIGNSFNRNDCFIAKLSLDGIRIWGSYFGGEAKDDPLSVTIDNNNNIILTGSTFSLTGISTSGSFKETRTQPVNFNTVGEGFVSKFNENGILIWSTYYGLCEIRSVDTDSNSNIFISGDTSSEDSNPFISTLGTHQPNFSYAPVSYYDSFIGKFDSNGQRLWGTYYGGYQIEYNHSLKVDLENNIYISGHTKSNTLISTSNSHQAINGGQGDAYIAKFNQNGNIIWGTYYGGLNSETSQSSTIDINNNNEIFLFGSTWSTNNISTNGTYSETLNGPEDCFIAKFNKNGIRIWGTYFGGSITEYSKKIAVDNFGGIYVMGYAYSADGIATPGTFQQTFLNSPTFFINKFFDCQSSTLASSNSPICIGNDLELNASGGTSFYWTGPNGFTSSEQNPLIQNANTFHSGLYTCAITGTSGGCDNNLTVNVVIGDSVAPIPTITNLPIITGDCNTVISTIPTAIDNCSGTINGTTTNPLSYTNPGNYSITWNYDDGNGNTSSQTQNVTISSVALPTLTSPQQFCFQENARINDIIISGQNIKWYDAAIDDNLLINTTLLQSGVTYYASQTINGCESERVPVLVTIQNSETPIGYLAQTFCANANSTLNDIVVTGQNITWYDSFVGGNIIPNTTLLQHQTTYYCTQTINGCESFRKPINIQLINTLNANNYSETICDDLDNGFETLNLSNYNSLLISSTGNIFKYYNSLNGAQNQVTSDEVQNSSNYNLSLGNNLFYVRIESPNTCFQIVTLNLTLVSKPFINIYDVMPICEGSSITIDAGFGYDNYTWSTGETSSSIIVTQPGNYSVTASENHGTLVCSTTKNFTVVNSNIGTISEIITSDWTQDENTISVLLSSNSAGIYEYSLNGIDFQDSNNFYGLENGEYTVFIRDKNGCGVSSEDVYLLMYPKYFTPNGDGYNDFWRIKFSENEPNLTVTIFDRYGKLITQFDSNNVGWNGTYQGNPMPSTDYWFVVKRENGKEYKGHFTLKR